MKHKGIWLINGLLALFAVPIAVMILIRRVDGSGYVETGRSNLSADGTCCKKRLMKINKWFVY